MKHTPTSILMLTDRQYLFRRAQSYIYNKMLQGYAQHFGIITVYTEKNIPWIEDPGYFLLTDDYDLVEGSIHYIAPIEHINQPWVSRYKKLSVKVDQLFHDTYLYESYVLKS